MARQTSVEAYQKITSTGVLGKMATKVYAALYHRGPATGREIDALLAAPGETRTSYHKRLPELRDVGVVYELVERRECKVTGRRAVQWDVTDRMPAEATPKNPSKAERYKVLVAEAIKLLRRDGLSAEAEWLALAQGAIEAGIPKSPGQPPAARAQPRLL